MSQSSIQTGGGGVKVDVQKSEIIVEKTGAAAATNEAKVKPLEKTAYKMMTWNVLAHEWTAYNTLDGKIESEAEKLRRWDQIDLILKTQEADIILLQEASVSFIEFLLQKQYDTKYTLATEFPSMTKKIGLLTLISKQAFVVVKSQTIQLPAEKPKSDANSRHALVSVIRNIDNNFLMVINTHLDGYPPLEKLRKEQASLGYIGSLITWSEAIKSETLKPQTLDNKKVGVVFAGDFNETKYKNFDNVLQCKELDALGGPLTLCTPIEKESETLVPTSFFVFKDEKKEEGKGIDYIWISSKSLVLTQPIEIWPKPDIGTSKTTYYLTKEFPAVPFKDVSWPSDHACLIIQFSFR